MAGRAPSSTKKASATEVESLLDWREILNEEAVWHDYDEFVVWFNQIAPTLVTPQNREFQKFRADLALIRSWATQVYFGQKPDVSAVNQRLNSIVLEIDVDATAGTRLPSLLAVAREGEGILDRLFGGLLVGFAQFVAAYQNGGPGLCRCEGVFRDARMSDQELTDAEKRYRQELSLLDEECLLEDTAIQRCADFFFGRSKARFCSDACRFMTFQISKQLKEPGYLAEKQRRYRSKRKDSLD